MGSKIIHLTSSFAAMDETAFWQSWEAVYTHRRGMNLGDLRGMTYLEVINDRYSDFTLSLDEVECVVRNKDGQRERLSPDFLLQKVDKDIYGKYDRGITGEALASSYIVYMKDDIMLVFWYEYDELEAEYGYSEDSNDYMLCMGLYHRNPPT